MAKKPVLTAAEAAKMIPDGATVMCGGFLACGQARAIVKELVKLGTKDLTLIANDMGRAVGPKGEEFFGIAELIHNHQVKRIIATHVGMTPEVGQQNTEGTLEVNLLPQGTLAECIRAAGAGLGGVLTPVGIDTLVEESPFCLGRKTVDGKDYLLMQPIHLAIGLVEGMITAAVLVFLYENRPELLRSPAEQTDAPAVGNRKKVLGVLTAAALFMGGILSHFASEDPDGLEWSLARITGSTELEGTEQGVHGLTAWFQNLTALFPDYKVPGLSPALGTALSGILGTLAVLGLVWALGRKLQKGRTHEISGQGH